MRKENNPFKEDKTMEEKVAKLKDELSHYETRDVLGMIGLQFLNFSNAQAGTVPNQYDIFNKTELMSPQKQYEYLAGLLMSTADNSDGTVQDDLDKQRQIERELQEITYEYIENFLGKTELLQAEDTQRRIVAMEAFVSYFDTGVLRYPEQTIYLIEELYRQYDSEFEMITGFTVTDCITFYKLVFTAFSDSFDIKDSVMSIAEIDSASDARKEEIVNNFRTAMNALCSIKKSQVEEKFAKKKADKLLETFALHRKEREFVYYNQNNPFSEHPLCWLPGDEMLFIVHPNFVLNAIYNFITSIFESSTKEFYDKYIKKKAEKIEELFLRKLKIILGNDARYYTNVCEQKGTLEHDIVVETKDCILIAEVKSSKVREPFFNPEKAYRRIKDHFDSDVGIGGAYKQAVRLKKYLESADDVVLYSNGNEIINIKNVAQKKIIPIVFTLNQFGGLAVNTSLILEKEVNQPFPWVCNWHDFDNLVKVFMYLKKKPEDFLDYLKWRIETHENILSSDELDVVNGYYTDNKVKECAKNDLVFFPPTGESIIDKIYFEEHGIPYMHRGLEENRKRRIKIGRNEPCPCGSGKKYKHCCLRKGIYSW